MQITRGKIEGAQKICCYGPEGIGKSTFAAQFPEPLFSDTEDSTKHMDVSRFPKPTSWTMLLEQARYVKANPSICQTYITDTADWAEKLCREHICSAAQKNSISDFSHGQGYVKLMEEFGKFLNLLSDIIDAGVHVVIVAHAVMRKFEQPDELGQYDRWEMKLEKKVYPLIKEWADMILFMNYETIVVNVDDKGAQKGKNKAQGGKRIMHTSHHPCWDAKNRHNLADKLPLDYSAIAHCIPARGVAAPVKPAQPVITVTNPNAPKEVQHATQTIPPTPPTMPIPQPESNGSLTEIFKPLADLMKANDVTPFDIQRAVASKGYYPVDTPIANYDPGFVSGVLVGAWAQVYQIILEVKKDDPF